MKSEHEAVLTSEEAAAVRGATLASGAKAMLLSVKGGASVAVARRFCQILVYFA